MSSKGIKIVLVGEAGVGKTNLIRVAMGQEFVQNMNSTLTSSFYEDQLEYNDKKYLFCLWDTAGQEQFRSLNKIFMKGAKIIMIVFAIDNKNSFNEVDFWIKYVKETLGEGPYILALIANKSDLYEEQEITDEEIIKKANENNIKYKITSAYSDAAGYKNFLDELIIDYIKLIGPEGEKNLTFTLIPKGKQKKDKKKCC